MNNEKRERFIQISKALRLPDVEAIALSNNKLAREFLEFYCLNLVEEEAGGCLSEDAKQEVKENISFHLDFSGNRIRSVDFLKQPDYSFTLRLIDGKVCSKE